MEVREIVQRIQSLYSKGVQSDDTRLSFRHIYNKMVSVRSKLINDQVIKNNKVGQGSFQTLDCVELEEVYLDKKFNIGCKVLKVKSKLPNILVSDRRHLIQFVTSIEGSVVYSETTWEQVKYKKYNKYTSSNPDYFLRDNDLYLTNNKAAKIITISALFEDPSKPLEYPSLCPKDLDYDIFKIDFCIDSHLIDNLVELSVKELVILFSQMKEDRINDSTDNNENNKR